MTAFSILSVVISVAVGGDGAPLHDAGGKGMAMPPANFNEDGQANHESLGHGYSRRGNYIYFDGLRIDQAGRETLERFQRPMGRELVLAHDVDAASFVPLSPDYTRDKQTVYYKWISPGRFWVVEIPNADAATFEVLDFNLARDATRVWQMDEPVRGADAATARVLHPGWVWRDADSVYYKAARIDGADPETFRHLDQAFYADAGHVYWSDTRLNGADVPTFRTFGNDTPYAVDKQHVWIATNRLVHVDAASFRLLHNHVFADKNGVYVSVRVLPVLDADTTTFHKVAELESWAFVLFSDARHAYLFDPGYGEMYQLSLKEDAVEITKPVWLAGAAGRDRYAATVTATWRDGALSRPVIRMRPGFEGSPEPTFELDKMQRMTDAIPEAMTLLAKEPAAD
ncbi:MAG: DKNYY domain-containing protein [Phycisphaerae bacterium]